MRQLKRDRSLTAHRLPAIDEGERLLYKTLGVSCCTWPHHHEQRNQRSLLLAYFLRVRLLLSLQLRSQQVVLVAQQLF